MSSIASFIKLPKTALAGLREAAVPKKRLLRAPRDGYPEYLKLHGQEVADYRWSGFVLATLLPYLEEQHQVALMSSEFDELGEFLSGARRTTHFIFTDAHKQAHVPRLDGPFSEQVLSDYFRDFNETDEPDAGRWMIDGIRVLRQCLSVLDEKSVILLEIG